MSPHPPVRLQGVSFSWMGAQFSAVQTPTQKDWHRAVSPLTSGSHSLFAAFVGGPQLSPSVSPAFIARIPGLKEGFALSLSANFIDLTLPQTQPVLISVSPAVEFSGNIQLSCANGVPSGYRCTFSPTALSGGVSQLRLERISRSSKLQSRLYFMISSTGLFAIVLVGTLRRKRRAAILLMLAVSGVTGSLSCGTPSTPREQKGMAVLSIRATAGSGTNTAIQSAQLILVSEAN